MRYFIRKSAQWFAFLTVTVAFFSSPIILRDHSSRNTAGFHVETAGRAGASLNFVPAVAVRNVTGDSAVVRMTVSAGEASGTLYLCVNGERQDSAFASGRVELEFPRVHLKDGDNEIEAVLLALNGDTLAAGGMRIITKRR